MQFQVYILRSVKDPRRHYTGLSSNAAERLRQHNSGVCGYTRAHGPWVLQTVIEFECGEKARAFEKYLKSGSGREFARRRL